MTRSPRGAGHLALALALALGAAATASAYGFSIDESGSRPWNYRLTALCKGVHHSVQPNVFKSTLFSSEGHDIQEQAYIGLELGVEEGRTVLLLRELGSVDNTFHVIGDASSLDDIRPAAGVTIRGTRTWEVLGFAWNLAVEIAPGTAPRKFQGSLFTTAAAAERILRHVAAGRGAESPENLRVLVSMVAHEAYHQGPAVWLSDKPAETWVADYRRSWVDPATAAVPGFDGKQRAALAQVNEEVLEAARAVLAEERKAAHPNAKMIAFDEAVVKALAELQQLLQE